MKHPDHRVMLGEPKRLRRKPLMVIVAVLLASLLVAEAVLQLALRAGWKIYRGFDTTSALAVDGKGQVWVAGYMQNSPSLTKYSGNGSSTALPLPGDLARTPASALMIDSQERLWVGTEEGMLGMRNSNGEWVIYAPEEYGNDSIRQIVEDAKGRVWVRSHRGPARVDLGSSEGTILFTNSGMPASDAVALTLDLLGQLWVLTRERELKVLDANDNWRTVLIVPATVRNGFQDSFLTFDPQGQIWLATVGGVGVLSPEGAWKEYPLGDPYRPLSMRGIFADTEGRVWVAAWDQGVFLYNPQSGWTNYSSQNSGLGMDAHAFALDRLGQVWIGSAQGRVSMFDQQAALPVNSISAIRTTARMIIPAVLLFFGVMAIVAAALRSPINGNERKAVAFALAFAGWFVIATVLWVYIRYSHAQSGGFLIISPLALIPPVVNSLLLILLWVKQRRMAWGAFSAFLMNWIGLIFITPAAVPFAGAPFMESVLMWPFFLLR